MKLLSGCIILSLFLLVLFAGCTSQNQTVTTPVTSVPTTQVTTEPTAIPTTANQTVEPVPAIVTDPMLSGTWYLKLMSEQNGTALVQTLNPQTNVIFDGKSGITGYSGCNDYSGIYTLTGKTNPNGKGITISNFEISKKICTDSNTEKTYVQILKASTSYLVNVNQELTLTDNAGNSLVFQRTPYSETSVPRGV
jgi:heat shock protein HslJ